MRAVPRGGGGARFGVGEEELACPAPVMTLGRGAQPEELVRALAAPVGQAQGRLSGPMATAAVLLQSLADADADLAAAVRTLPAGSDPQAEDLRQRLQQAEARALVAEEAAAAAKREQKVLESRLLETAEALADKDLEMEEARQLGWMGRDAESEKRMALKGLASELQAELRQAQAELRQAPEELQALHDTLQELRKGSASRPTAAWLAVDPAAAAWDLNGDLGALSPRSLRQRVRAAEAQLEKRETEIEFLKSELKQASQAADDTRAAEGGGGRMANWQASFLTGLLE